MTIHDFALGNGQQPLLSAVTPAASLRKSAGLAAAYAAIREGRPLPRMGTRVATVEEIGVFDREISEMGLTRTDELVTGKKVKETNGTASKLTEILNQASMNRPTVFPEATIRAQFEAQISAAIREGGPLVVVIPLGGGKAPVTLKTGGVEMPDDSERLMLAYLSGLAGALRAVYPRTYLLIVPDAPLHGDLGFHPEVVAAHLNRLRTAVSMMGIDGMVYVADTASLLPADLYTLTIEDGEHEVLRRARVSVSEAHKLVAQASSLQFIVRPPQLALDEAVLFYGGLAYGASDLPAELAQQVADFRDKVNRVTVRMAAVNAFGLREPIGLVRRAVEQMFGVSAFVRATVHAKPGEIRPLLRAPNELDSPGLLPMHGLAFRVTTASGLVRWGMTFAIDARMRRWTAVYDSRGQFRHFEATGVDAGG